MNGTSQTIASLDGGGTTGGKVYLSTTSTAGTLTVGSGTFAGIIANGASGCLAGQLIKQGSGTLTLTAPTPTPA